MLDNKYVWFILGVVFVMFVWPMVSGMLAGRKKPATTA